jgi:hypothetical protein
LRDRFQDIVLRHSHAPIAFTDGRSEAPLENGRF